MDSAWDRLLDLVDRAVATPGTEPSPEVEKEFAELSAEAIDTGDIDGELHPPDIARWLTGLVAAHGSLRLAAPDVDPDTDLANLRRIVVRWLHPARPR